MAIGGPTKPLNVTPEEKQNLSMLARRPKSAQAMAMGARIVLGCSEGLSNGEVAKRMRIAGGATACKGANLAGAPPPLPGPFHAHSGS
jgi:hypothetical protein